MIRYLEPSSFRFLRSTDDGSTKDLSQIRYLPGKDSNNPPEGSQPKDAGVPESLDYVLNRQSPTTPPRFLDYSNTVNSEAYTIDWAIKRARKE
jgi:hypothetical protein